MYFLIYLPFVWNIFSFYSVFESNVEAELNLACLCLFVFLLVYIKLLTGIVSQCLGFSILKQLRYI